MSIRTDKILPFIVRPVSKGDMVGDLVRDILVLQEKISNIGNQSFYFSMAIQSHSARLDQMKAEYNRYRQLINETPVDDFIALLNEAKKDSAKWEKKWKENPNTVNKIASSGFQSRLSESENLLTAKDRYNSLKPLDECLNDEVSLLAFFE